MQSGERALVRALLDDAISALLDTGTSRKKQRLRAEAHAWIWGDDPSWPFCFDNVCAWLHMDASYIRSGLKVALAQHHVWVHRPTHNTKHCDRLAQQTLEGQTHSHWHGLGRNL